MPLEFSLPDRPAGFCITAAGPGEKVGIIAAEIVPATDPAAVQQRLVSLQRSVFRHIPRFEPSSLGHLLLIIRPDLTALAYCNELKPLANVRITRDVKQGDPVFFDDVSEIIELTLGVDVPDDAGVVHYMCMEWKRTLYFDFMPLLLPPKPRIGPLKSVGAQQLMSLWEFPSNLEKSLPKTMDGLKAMSDGFQKLRALASSNETKESQVQELLQEHPWMLGGDYRKIERHTAMDDKNIPDFTAIRSDDDCRDIIEIKLPQAKCSRKDGSLSAEFNAHWDQTERYVDFATTDRDYLLRQKNLRFENPKAWLIVGQNLEVTVLAQIRRKARQNPRITVLTYDQLMSRASRVLSFVRAVDVGDLTLATDE